MRVLHAASDCLSVSVSLQMFLVALSFAYFAKALSGSYMKSTITQLERRFDIPSYLIGVIDGSFEMGKNRIFMRQLRFDPVTSANQLPRLSSSLSQSLCTTLQCEITLRCTMCAAIYSCRPLRSAVVRQIRQLCNCKTVLTGHSTVFNANLLHMRTFYF